MPALGRSSILFANNALTKPETELKGKSTGQDTIVETDCQARGVVSTSDEPRKLPLSHHRIAETHQPLSCHGQA